MANADDSFLLSSCALSGQETSFLVGPPLIANSPVTAVFPHVCGSQPSVRPGTVAPASEV